MDQQEQQEENHPQNMEPTDSFKNLTEEIHGIEVNLNILTKLISDLASLAFNKLLNSQGKLL